MTLRSATGLEGAHIMLGRPLTHQVTTFLGVSQRPPTARAILPCALFRIVL